MAAPMVAVEIVPSRAVETSRDVDQDRPFAVESRSGRRIEVRIKLLAGTYIQADETPVDVQMHDGSGVPTIRRTSGNMELRAV